MHHHIRLALALSVLAFAAPARATEFAAGDGSPASPYVIRNAAQLAKFRDIVNGANGETKNRAACARLAADIDLAGAAWTPIGAFTGTFDGQGHTIGGLSVDLQSGGSEVYAGLFGYLGENGTVKDLGVCGDVAARGTACYAGGIAGYNLGTVEGCFHAGSVTADSSRYNSDAGGVVGSNNGTVRNCRHAGSVASTASEIARGGGVVGDNTPMGAVRNCYAVGAVTATGDGNKFAGGVAGTNSYGTMENCYYDTTVAGNIGAVAGEDIDGDATGATTAEMQGWDALSRLALNAGLDAEAWTATAGYPELKAFVAYPLWIGGARFTAGNLVIDADDDPGIASGTATYDPASNTLWLTNFVYSGPGLLTNFIHRALYYEAHSPDFVIDVSGTNRLALVGAGGYSFGLDFRRGNGQDQTTVTIRSADGGRLSVAADAANYSYGIYAAGADLVIDGAAVSAVGGGPGLYYSFGAYLDWCRLTIKSGSLAAKGGKATNYDSVGVFFSSSRESLFVKGGSLIATGGEAGRASYGIGSDTPLSFTGGETLSQGGTAGIADASLSVADGLAVSAGADADSAAAVEGDGWKNQKCVRIGPVAYPVWVAGRQVTGANATNVLGDASASVSFAGTATNGTLTLRDASITEPFGYAPDNNGYVAIYTKPDSNFALTVALEGTNRVGSAEFAYGFKTWSPLTITGGGVLFAVADELAIFSYPSVLIDGATVFAEGRRGFDGPSFAATNATVQATGRSVGISYNRVQIGGDSTVVAEGGAAALGCYPPENFSLGDGLAVLEPAGGTPDLYVPALGSHFISSGGAAATRVVIGPPPPAVAATVTFNNGNGAVVYDGQGHGVEVEVTDPADGAAVLFALGDSSGPTETFGPTAPMFTNACDATVWVEIAAEGYATVTNHANVTITNAPLTIAAKDQAYAYNGQTQGEGDTLYATPGDIAEKVAVSGLAPGDGLASIILDGQGTDPDTYPLVPSGATVTNATGVVTFNYAVGYANGTLTIEEPPPPVVSNVVARQRWPWNGLVDVDYEISGYTAGLKAEIVFEEQGGTNRWTATKFFADVEPTLNPGLNRATWDSKAEGATDLVATVVATMRLVREE